MSCKDIMEIRCLKWHKMTEEWTKKDRGRKQTYSNLHYMYKFAILYIISSKFWLNAWINPKVYADFIAKCWITSSISLMRRFGRNCLIVSFALSSTWSKKQLALFVSIPKAYKNYSSCTTTSTTVQISAIIPTSWTYFWVMQESPATKILPNQYNNTNPLSWIFHSLSATVSSNSYKFGKPTIGNLI